MEEATRLHQLAKRLEEVARSYIETNEEDTSPGEREAIRRAADLAKSAIDVIDDTFGLAD